MRILRRILFWCHLTAGVITAAVVVLMSVTGVLLMYQKQITAWADRRAARVTPPTAEAARLPIEDLLGKAAAAAGATPRGFTVRSRADAPVEVAFEGGRRELVDPYSGTTLGQGGTGVRKFFSVVTAWHRTLGATGEKRALGRAITGAANLAFLFLVVSGFYLWWPRNWTTAAFRNGLLFRRGLSGKARDFNWHNVIGFWSAIPLFIIVLSGVVISYRWAGDLVYEIAGERPPAPTPPAGQGGGEPALSSEGLNALLARAEGNAPGWTAITVQIPRAESKTATFALDRGMGGQPQLRSQLILDRKTGETVRDEPFATQTPGRRLRSILRFAHTGEVLGFGGQTIAGLVSLGAVVLGITGVTLAIRRLASWSARRRWDRRPATNDDDETGVAAA